jgi:hypothetical protein
VVIFRDESPSALTMDERAGMPFFSIPVCILHLQNSPNFSIPAIIAFVYE